jgi:hypothetical protein
MAINLSMGRCTFKGRSDSRYGRWIFSSFTRALIAATRPSLFTIRCIAATPPYGCHVQIVAHLVGHLPMVSTGADRADHRPARRCRAATGADGVPRSGGSDPWASLATTRALATGLR